MNHRPTVTLRNPWIYLTLIALILTMLCGCASAGKSIATASTTVDSAMKGWAVYAYDHKPTPEQMKEIDKALTSYQLAEDVALKAFLEAQKTGDRTAYQKALAAMLATQADLLTLLNTIQGKAIK
jgi:3-methyladenine DNA glycosylase/8-oxoguanine DNA glycosylase